MFNTYSTFRLLVNMYAGSFGYWVLIICSILWMAIISACRIFWWPCSLLVMLSPLGLYMSYPAIPLLHTLGAISLGSSNDPSV